MLQRPVDSLHNVVPPTSSEPQVAPSPSSSALNTPPQQPIDTPKAPILHPAAIPGSVESSPINDSHSSATYLPSTSDSHAITTVTSDSHATTKFNLHSDNSQLQSTLSLPLSSDVLSNRDVHSSSVASDASLQEAPHPSICYYFSIDLQANSLSLEQVYPLDSLFSASHCRSVGDTVAVDSVAVDTIAVDTVKTRSSIFVGHDLQPEHQIEVPRIGNGASGYIFLVVFLLTFATGLFFRLHRLSLKDAFFACFSRFNRDRVLRENNFPSLSSLLPIAVLLASNLSLFAFMFYHELSSRPFIVSDFWLCIIFFLVALAFFLVRNALVSSLGNTFGFSSDTNNYHVVSFFFMLLESVVLLPLLCIGFFFPGFQASFLWTLLIPLVFLVVLRIIICMKQLLTKIDALKLFLFYYLCTLEIVPFIVVIKVLLS